MFKRILLAIADAEDTSQTIETVAALAKAFSADVTVYHARERVVTSATVIEDESIRESSKYGERVVKQLVKEGVRATAVVESIRPDRLADHVLAHAEATNADLIVIGGHHPHNLRESVFGDIGKALAHRAQCPVLLMPSAVPAGLPDREVEVLRLISLGRNNRDVAERLFISSKTVGRHIENIYSKIGTSTRPAAAVFAMQHQLLS